VRTADGNVHSLSGLPWLQKWILERRVSAHDQVSMDGQTWRRLSELSELEAAFRMVDQSNVPASSPVKRPSTLEDLAVEVDASRGSLPQAVSQQETDLVTLAQRRRGPLKLAVCLAITAVVSYAGINFQEGRGRRLLAARTATPTAVSAASSQATARPVVQPLPAPPAVVPPVPEPEPAEEPVAATPPPAKARTSSGRVADSPTGESYEALVAQAERLLQKRSGVKAQQHFEQAIKLRPSGPEALNGLGQLALNRGQLGPAGSYFKRAIADRPFPPALFGLGEVYRGSANRDLALQFYKRYLQVAPNGAHSALARRRISAIESH
jgi:tetratricopeptide (TPR) repeat protein